MIRPISTSNLRVALLTNSLSPHTLPLCEGINRRVRELRAFVSAPSDTFHDFPRPQASFKIVVQRSFNALRLRYRTEDFSIREPMHLPMDTVPQLVRYKPDVILSGQFGARTLFAILYRKFHPRVRLVLWAALSVHTESERSRLRRGLRRWMLRRVDGVFVNGRSGEQYLRALGFSGPAWRIPYTIDDSLFRSSRYEPQAQDLRLLFCGRVDLTKGVLRFCRALHRWCAEHPQRRIRLQIIGNGPDCASIQALPPLANLSLHLLPRIGQKELAGYYHQADIFAFPSLLDEWGVVVNEAMSAGLPVLGSIYSQAAVELIADGANGWLCDPKSEENLFASLHRALCTSAEELRSMSACARSTVDKIAPGVIAERAVQAIADLCGVESSRPAPSPDLSLTRATAISVP